MSDALSRSLKLCDSDIRMTSFVVIRVSVMERMMMYVIA